MERRVRDVGQKTKVAARYTPAIRPKGNAPLLGKTFAHHFLRNMEKTEKPFRLPMGVIFFSLSPT